MHHWMLGITFNELGNGKRAEAALNRAHALGRNDSQMALAFVESKLLQRRYTDVLVKQASAKVADDDWRLLVLKGEAYLALAQFEQSLMTLRLVLARDVNNERAMLAMTRVFLAQNNPTEAERYLHQLQSLGAVHPEIRILAGRIALARERFDVARRLLENPRPTSEHRKSPSASHRRSWPNVSPMRRALISNL